MNQIYKINDLVEGEIISRPSKKIKTPFVADIKLKSNNEIILGHTASLGCCGLADVGATILMAPSKNEKSKCDYVVYLSIFKEKNQNIIVGIYPKLAEILTERALTTNLLSKLKNIKLLKREEKILNSRFDFSGIDENNIPFYMEVKNVPLADYEDLPSKEKKKCCFKDRLVDSKVAYFPDGYRKKATDTVSPRALKHMNDLIELKKKHKNKIRCLMCYVIQRTDVDRFQPSIIDPEYKNAFVEAIKVGVEIITMVIKWTKNGNAYFITDNLPINKL
jgi:DNA-binding sugar fermentation-stimulating protein